MRTFDIADHVGSLKDGKMANIVVWRPAFFGIKPELVIKGGFIAWGAMGDNAASLMTCEPMRLRAQWGAHGLAKQGLSANFVHPLSIEGGFLAHTPDPLVLFPGASLSAATSVTLAAGTCEIIADGIAWHDPTERGRPFEMLVQEFTVGNERSDVLVHERGTLRGEVFLDGRFAAPTVPRRRHRTASRDRGPSAGLRRRGLPVRRNESSQRGGTNDPLPRAGRRRPASRARRAYHDRFRRARRGRACAAVKMISAAETALVDVGEPNHLSRPACG